MFLPHLSRCGAPQVPAASVAVPVCPVPVIVSKQRHPRLDRGCVLDCRFDERCQWIPFSYHSTVADAVRAFDALPHHCVWGDMETRWRILAHELDLGEYGPLAVRQPEPVDVV